MNVTIISHTTEARELLLFTKATRLSMNGSLMDEIRAWPEEKKQKELDYMLRTIESSWEFCDYVFSIEGVSRSFTHQLVRTRDADIPDEDYCGPRHKKLLSIAQQSQRTVAMEDFKYLVPKAIEKAGGKILDDYLDAMEALNATHSSLLEDGVAPQDARELLPHGVETNIIIKVNLRTLSEMAKLRLCTRTQGQYQDVFRLMRAAVIAIHPWTEPFLRVYCAAVGVCCFPNYKECPIKPGIFNPETGGTYVGTFDNGQTISLYGNFLTRPLNKAEIQVRWEGTRFEAIPQETK